jgi:hypothetical protein
MRQLVVADPKDNQGMQIKIKRGEKIVKQVGSQKGWDNGFSITLDNNAHRNSLGSSSYEHGQSRELYEGFEKAIAKVLKARPDQVIEISFHLYLEN